MNTEPSIQRSAKLFLTNPEGDVFVLVRSAACTRNKGRYDLPGGKRERDSLTKEFEPSLRAVVRETTEESTLREADIALGGVVFTWRGVCDDGVEREKEYLVGFTSRDPQAQGIEHTSALWLPLGDLPARLPNPSDRQAAAYVLAHELLARCAN